MSLVVRISVNDDPPIEIVVARRVYGPEDPAPDDECLYDVKRFDTKAGYVRQMGDSVQVPHRYGDGAAVLVHKALGKVLGR